VRAACRASGSLVLDRPQNLEGVLTLPNPSATHPGPVWRAPPPPMKNSGRCARTGRGCERRAPSGCRARRSSWPCLRPIGAANPGGPRTPIGARASQQSGVCEGSSRLLKLLNVFPSGAADGTFRIEPHSVQISWARPIIILFSGTPEATSRGSAAARTRRRRIDGRAHRCAMTRSSGCS